jgi:hypothetical protein
MHRPTDRPISRPTDRPTDLLQRRPHILQSDRLRFLLLEAFRVDETEPLLLCVSVLRTPEIEGEGGGREREREKEREGGRGREQSRGFVSVCKCV